MSEHRASVEWHLRGADFRYETYSRAHEIRFDGVRISGNAAPGNVPSTVKPEAGADPEQAFVASLSACHMLWFLHLACQAKWIVEPCLK